MSGPTAGTMVDAGSPFRIPGIRYVMQILRTISRFSLPGLVLLWALPLAADEGAVVLSAQDGETTEAFLVKDCTGPAAGKTLCYACRYGQRPVVAIFAEEWNDQVAELAVRVDRLVANHRDQRLASLVVLLQGDTTALETQLQRQSQRHRLVHTPLTIYRDAREKLRAAYKVPDSTKLTALFWQNGQITCRLELSEASKQPSLADALEAAIRERLVQEP